MDRLPEIEIDLLWHQAQAGFRRLKIRIDVVAEYLELPAVLLTSELMMPIAVVLPAPLGPSRA